MRGGPLRGDKGIVGGANLSPAALRDPGIVRRRRWAILCSVAVDQALLPGPASIFDIVQILSEMPWLSQATVRV